MASLHTGSDRVLYLKTEKLEVTIKGKSFHPCLKGISYKNDDSSVGVFCRDDYELSLHGASETYTVNRASGSFYDSYLAMPLFFEQQNYELVIDDRDGDDQLEFWHDNFNVRSQITRVGSHKDLLSGVINFRNDIGYSDLVIRINGKDYVRLTIEVFPSKISYKDDYAKILDDITSEVYSLIFDVLKKTYLGYQQDSATRPSPVEFFAVIRKIYGNFVRAADIILAHPHHQLETVHEVLPSYKIKRSDMKTLKWVAKHPHQVQKLENRVAVNKALAVRKRVTYDTNENRLTKYILESTMKRLQHFKKNYLRPKLKNDSKETVDSAIIRQIDQMIGGIHRRCTVGFLAGVSAHEASSGMSLVFSMAPGYRDLFKYYVMLQRGLSVSGDVFNISVKNIAVLYEYWCFIKLNSLLRDDPHYQLKSQNIVKTQGNGLYVALVHGQQSDVTYKNLLTDDTIILSYNRLEEGLPTTPQKPDNVLSLTKHGGDAQYEYIFDAKYRINAGGPNSGYVSENPGPEVSDINTMHRYRDAIVSQSKAAHFERTMFGAYVLFPYHNEEEYRSHHFYESIEKVNIGGLPFLPNATSLVKDMLDQLISDSPESAIERATLPRGIEEKLAKVDWSVRDVLVGALSDRSQLDLCLEHKFYHIPRSRVKDSNLPIHYVALYQSGKMFGAESGIYYYGEVTGCACIKRRDIIEIPKESDELYYRLEIKEWKELSNPIVRREIGVVSYFTNLFLLQHSTEVPELWIRSNEEYRLYYELKRCVLATSINGNQDHFAFRFKDFVLSFDKGNINLLQGMKRVKDFDIGVFSKHPNAVFRQMLKEMKQKEKEHSDA